MGDLINHQLEALSIARPVTQLQTPRTTRAPRTPTVAATDAALRPRSVRSSQPTGWASHPELHEDLATPRQQQLGMNPEGSHFDQLLENLKLAHERELGELRSRLISSITDCQTRRYRPRHIFRRWTGTPSNSQPSFLSDHDLDCIHDDKMAN